MAEVLTIHGGKLPGEPVDEVVADLEALLERAKRGELLGLAYATVSNEKVLATGWSGGAGSRNSLGCAVGLLQHRYMQAVLETSELVKK